jgi:hypothetical protein
MEVAGCWKRRKQQRMRDKSERMQGDGSNDNGKEKMQEEFENKRFMLILYY